MTSELKKHLSSTGAVTEADIEKAEQHSEKEGISLEDSLLALNMIQASDLGKVLAQANGLPYKKLSGHLPPKGAKDMVSVKSAKRWGVFPVDYNPALNLTTVAVKDSDHAQKMSRIYRFLFDAQNVAFTVAPEKEIKDAIETLVPKAAKPARKPAAKTLRTTDQSKAPKSDGSEGQADVQSEDPGKKRLLTWTSDKPKKEKAEAKPLIAKKPEAEKKPAAPAPKDSANEQAEQLMNSLSSAVSMLVTAHLSGNTQALSMARAAARYCQLIAVRMNFSAEQTVRLVISAWLSALKDKPEVIKQFSSPYDLESIIFNKDSDNPPVEALVLGLIQCYQDIERESLGDFRDVNFVRRHLHVEWSGAGTHEDIIETFLQILMDEQFINKFDQAAGTILLLDAEGTAVTEIESPLTRAGYNVHIVDSVEDAQAFSYESSPDFIIANAARNESVVIDFCKKMKSDAGSKAVPLEVLVSDSSKVRGAEFMRAGADDFLSFPVDIELLYLKIEKQVQAAAARPGGASEGVTGSLSDMSFCDMMQMLNASGKSMDITVTRGDLSGKVVLQQGNVIHSQLGDTVGENAFYDMMQWTDGNFSMIECTDFPEPTVTSSTMSLLMEGARLADEENKD